MQYVYFISEEKPLQYPEIDDHYTWYPIHKKLSFEEFSELWQENEPYAIYSYGKDIWSSYTSQIFNVRKRCIHLRELPEKLNVVENIFSSCIRNRYDDDHPLISVITSTFHSKEKILRPLRSLQNQTYTNWEWVIWDDSKNNYTYENLLDIQKKDLRIRVYKAPKHSGSIGEMKRLASGVAYGSFILELDHDDDLHPELLKWIVDASKKHEDADFFYCDAAMIHEKSLKPHSFSEFYSYGYGSHVNMWSDLFNKWITQLTTSTPNPVTLQHLIGLPNHVRVWRTAFYDKIGKHNPRLSVSDDYDLLIKSFINGKWCHILSCGYYQYLNEDGNFTFIRNSLIQHNVRELYKHYKHLLPKIPENYKYQPYWKHDDEQFPVLHLTYDPYPHDYSIIMMKPTKEKVERIMKINDVSLYIYMLDDFPDLDNLPIEWKRKISWWKIKDESLFDNNEEKIRYLTKLARGKYIIIDDEFNIPPLEKVDPKISHFIFRKVQQK